MDNRLPNEVRCRAGLETINQVGVSRLVGGFQRQVRISFYRSNGALISSHLSDACTYASDRPSAAVDEVPSGTAFVETEWKTFGNQAREGGRVYHYVEVA